MGKRMTEEQKQEIVNLKKEGKTFDKIAEFTGRSIGAIQYVLKNSGLVKTRVKKEEKVA